MEKVKVGIIGCGNISNQYVEGCGRFEILDLMACADIDLQKALDLADKHDLTAYSVAELLADPEIEIVINLTIPEVHAAVNLDVIAAGKHVYSEKPLATLRADGQKVLTAAEAAGVRVGCAPDTFLGGGLQTCRKLIDDGWIGQPVAATAFMMSHGPESWHPNPVFFYQPGAGPLFDMGPYYLTTLISLMGPIDSVFAAATISFAERTATSAAKFGERIPVHTPTHVSSLLNYDNGAVGSMITSFDVWASEVPRIEIYGSAGSLSVPDPNSFGGQVRLRRPGDDGWQPIPLTHTDQVLRGIGVADMATAIRSGRAHRANGEMAYHVLDIMEALLDSSKAGQQLAIESSCSQPAPLPLGLLRGRLDT